MSIAILLRLDDQLANRLAVEARRRGVNRQAVIIELLALDLPSAELADPNQLTLGVEQ